MKAQIAEKEKLIARYQEDRKILLPKGPSKTGDRLQALTAAAERVRGYLRYWTSQRASLVELKNEVEDLRRNRAPEALRSLKERHFILRLEAAAWDWFLLKYSGDVDSTVATKTEDVEKNASWWKGSPPTAAIDDSGAFLSE